MNKEKSNKLCLAQPFEVPLVYLKADGFLLQEKWDMTRSISFSHFALLKRLLLFAVYVIPGVNFHFQFPLCDLHKQTHT